MDTTVLRIVDVNVNRAREALRVIEDYARFVLDDGEAAGAVKACRHALVGIVEAIGAEGLLGARDIVGDVGREVKTERELQRDSVEAVVRAAFVRLQEAGRGLGEYGKLLAGEGAGAAETLRYRAYELEQRIVLRGALRRRFRDVRVYLLLTEGFCRGDWLETAAVALRGGVGCVQLREKELEGGELLQRAKQLRSLTREHGALLAVNDRPDIARLAGADVCHVGQGDLSVRDARRVAGAGVLVGKSTHTREQFEAALSEEPDYVAAGPMFQSVTKPQEHIAGVEMLAWARGRTALPIVAIGGIDAENVREVAAAGADCVAVCRAVLGAEDVEQAVRRLVAGMDAARIGVE